MEDKSLSEKLIEGLQSLYAKLTDKPAANKEVSKDSAEEVKSVVPVSAPATLPLNELFAKRLKEWKIKRIKTNESNTFLKIPRVVMLKYLLPYFEVNEVCKLCEVCICFNSLIKSTIFFHYYVSLHEKTGIAINLGETLRLSGAKKTPKAGQSAMEERSAREDAEAQLKSLQETREFLSSRLKESRANVKKLKNNIHELRVVLEAEKGTKEKALAKASQLENEISEYKRKSHSTMIIMENRMSDLEKDIQEKEKDVSRLKKQEKRLSQIEAKYKEENSKLEETLSDLEDKNLKKATALQSLCDHFFNTTYPKLEGMISKGDDPNASRNEDLSIIQSLEIKPKK